MERIERIERLYRAKLDQLGVPADKYSLPGVGTGDAGFYLVPRPAGAWWLTVIERGRIVDRREFGDDESLLYHLVRDVVAVEGSEWQANHACAEEDPRRADFARRLELMGRISPEWRQRLALELAQWLARHPYVDRPQDTDVTLQPKRGLGGVLLVALLLAGWGGLHLPLWHQWQEERWLQTQGDAARALVTARHLVDGRFADSYRIDYAYVVNGAVHRSNDQVDWRRWRSVQPDASRVDIVFDPTTPSRSMVAGNGRAVRLAWAYAAVDLLIVLVFLREWRLAVKARRRA